MPFESDNAYGQFFGEKRLNAAQNLTQVSANDSHSPLANDDPTSNYNQSCWMSYQQFTLQGGHIKFEDRAIEKVEIFSDITEMDDTLPYLYVMDLRGEISFSTQFTKDGVKLTHAALVRKANELLFSGKTPEVLAAGLIRVSEVDKKIYLSLASGHFLPKFTAYQAILTKLAVSYQEYEIHILGLPEKPGSYYKSLDLISCNLANTEELRSICELQQKLVTFINSKEAHYLHPLVIDLLRRTAHMYDIDYEPSIGETVDFRELFYHDKLREILSDYESILPGYIQQSFYSSVCLR